jgi:hypothetical protein
MSQVVHQWLAQMPTTRKWRVLGWKMTEKEAQAWAAASNIRKFEKVAGTAEVREVAPMAPARAA